MMQHNASRCVLSTFSTMASSVVVDASLSTRRMGGDGCLLSRIHTSPYVPSKFCLITPAPLLRPTPACARLLPLAARSSLILRQSSPGKTAAVDHSGESSQTLSSHPPAAQQGAETHCPWDNTGRVPLSNAAARSNISGHLSATCKCHYGVFEVCRGYGNILLLYPSCPQAL